MTLLLITSSGCEHHEHMMQLQAKVAADSVYRMHMVTGQAVALVADGSSMQLAADMGTSPGTDDMLRAAGTDLVNRGQEMLSAIEEVVVSQEPEDAEAESAYVYTRDLLQAAQAYVREAQGLRGEADQPHAHHPAAHHAHLLVNNAVKEAVAGAEIQMLANMGIAADLQGQITETGKEMVQESSALVHQAMSQALSEMAASPADGEAAGDHGAQGHGGAGDHAGAGSGDVNPRLHTYAQAASAFIAKLSEMEGEGHAAGGGAHTGHNGDHSGH